MVQHTVLLDFADVVDLVAALRLRSAEPGVE